VLLKLKWLLFPEKKLQARCDRCDGEPLNLDEEVAGP